MNALNNDYLGFLKFLTRAKKDIVSWFALYFNNDAKRIAFMAAREWDGMDDNEKKYFILATQPAQQLNGLKKSRFVSQLIQKHYADPALHDSYFNNVQCNEVNQTWNSSEGQALSSRKIVDICMDHIIKQRTKLHLMYKPLELNTLEFLLKTKPNKPLSSRAWYFKQRNLSIRSRDQTCKESWNTMEDPERHIYHACAALDGKRYKFETSYWLTRLVTLDLSSENLSLNDFRAPQLKSNLETLCSIIEDSSKAIPVELRKKRPRGPFSLFIEHHRYQTKNEKPEFRFAEHLKRSSEAWHKLSGDKKEVFREQSRRLKMAREEEISKEDPEAYIPKDLFRINKSIHGPCHPKHLVPMRPSLINFYGRANNIPIDERKKSWNSLPQSDKEAYIRQYEETKKSIDDQKKSIKEKVENIKKLMNEARELEKLKIELELIPVRKSRN